MSKINFDYFPKLRKELKNQKIVLCSGTFDLVHAGHVLFFEDCKKLGDKLVTIIAGDNIIRKIRGKDRPIMNEHIRLKMVDSLKSVDYCVLDDFTHNHDDPLYAIEFAFNKLRPDVYAINKDAFNIPHRKELCDKYGVNLQILERTCPKEFDKISTTKIIQKIKKL